MTNVNIEKMLENRVEMLQSLQNSRAAIELMLVGANLVVEGGAEGIAYVAQMDGGPEMLLASIVSFVHIVKSQQDEIAQITESWMQAQDNLIEVSQIINEASSQKE